MLYVFGSKASKASKASVTDLVLLVLRLLREDIWEVVDSMELVEP